MGRRYDGGLVQVACLLLLGVVCCSAATGSLVDLTGGCLAVAALVRVAGGRGH